MATNGFGSSTFLHYVLFTQTFIIIAVFVRLMKSSSDERYSSWHKITSVTTSVIFVNENENGNEKDKQFVHENEN